jgi:hypothetical protein
MAGPTMPAVPSLRTPALAQAPGRYPLASETVEIWAHNYCANKDGVKLNLWRKRIGAPPIRPR